MHEQQTLETIQIQCNKMFAFCKAQRNIILIKHLRLSKYLNSKNVKNR